MNMELDFNKGQGLIPAIVQDSQTHQVLMLGFMDEAALLQTRKSGKVTFFSRTKKRLWTKGETSGNYLILESIEPDCDGDTLLVKVRPQGPVCHKGTDTCFGSRNRPGALDFLHHLQDIIKSRRQQAPSGSYTASLFSGGTAKIAQKVGEEAVEVVIAAMDGNSGLREEAADLIFHLMVLLEDRQLALDEVIDELRERHIPPDPSIE